MCAQSFDTRAGICVFRCWAYICVGEHGASVVIPAYGETGRRAKAGLEENSMIAAGILL